MWRQPQMGVEALSSIDPEISVTCRLMRGRWIVATCLADSQPDKMVPLVDG